jgi:hypothetical protein
VVCYSNGSDAVLDDDVLVVLGVSNLHGTGSPYCQSRSVGAFSGSSLTISAGKFAPEHRQTTLRLGLGRFVL